MNAKRYFKDNIVGLRFEQAKQLAESQGFVLRVMREDGEHYIGTCDYRTNRLNIAIDDGAVTDLLRVG